MYNLFKIVFLFIPTFLIGDEIPSIKVVSWDLSYYENVCENKYDVSDRTLTVTLKGEVQEFMEHVDCHVRLLKAQRRLFPTMSIPFLDEKISTFEKLRNDLSRINDIPDHN